MKTKFTTARKFKQSASTKGFTLIEVIISAFLLVIIMLALYGCFITGYGSIKSSREDLRATQIMTQRLEDIRLCNWTTQLSNYPTAFVDFYNPNGVSNGTAGVTYTGIVSTTGVATNIPDSVNYKSQVHLITVQVTWKDMGGNNSASHTRQMQTLVAYNGLQNYIWGNAK